MDREQEKKLSRMLVITLIDRFDKCTWEKTDDSEKRFRLNLQLTGSIIIDQNVVWIYNKEGKMILRNGTSAEHGDAANLSILWKKVYGKFHAGAEQQVELVMKELENLT